MIKIKLAWLNIKGKKFKYAIMFILLFITSLGDSLQIILKLAAVHVVALVCAVPCSFYWIYKKAPSDMIKEVGG